MSYYLSKSKKDFKPKVPLRRTSGGRSSTPSSLRSNVEQLQQSLSTPPIPDVEPTANATAITQNAPNRALQSTHAISVRRSQSEVLSALSSSHNVATNTTVLNTPDAPADDGTLQTSPSQEEPHPPIANTQSSLRLDVISQAQNLSVRDLKESTQLLSESGRIEVGQSPTKRRRITTFSEKAAPRPLPSTSFKDAATSEERQVQVQVQVQEVPPQDGKSENVSKSHIGAKKREKAIEEGIKKPKNVQQRHGAKKRLKDASITVEATGAIERSSKSRKIPRRARQRAQTPDSAENVRIAPSSLTMAELCRDTHTGKKSSREVRLQEREAAEKAAKARGQLQELMGEPGDALETTVGQAGQLTRPSRTDHPPPQPITVFAPQVRLVNGQIIHDEESRTIDRHEAAELARPDEEVREEDELTRKINSASYMKPRSQGKWTGEMTERFYDALRYFGTDFMMMTTLFPDKSRRQLKLKFVKEERADKELIKRILLYERRLVDLAELERLSGMTFRDPKDLEKDMANDRERLEEEQRREVDAMHARETEQRSDAATAEKNERQPKFVGSLDPVEEVPGDI